jgi:hypothetical protein
VLAVSCEPQEGERFHHNHLPTHYLKQIAQSLIIEIAMLRPVMSRIAVIAPSKSKTRGTSDKSVVRVV